MNHQAKFPKGIPMTIDEVAAVVGEEFKEMNENPPPEVIAVREQMEGKVARQRLTWPKVAESVPGGLYGYPKLVQRSAETATRKLARSALKIAKRIFSKDGDVVPFLQAHAKRDGSKSAKVLLSALREVGPKLAATMRGGRVQTAGLTEYGLYGFKTRTVSLGLQACTDVRTAAGRITADLHMRRAADHSRLTGFFREHSKQGKCAYSNMLFSCYPDAAVKFASHHLIHGDILPHHSIFVHASNQSVRASGILQGIELLPLEFQAVRQRLIERLASRGVQARSVHYQLNRFTDVVVSASTHDDGSTRDAEGVAAVVVAAHGDVEHATLGFTGTYTPGPRVSVLASGDLIEWVGW